MQLTGNMCVGSEEDKAPALPVLQRCLKNSSLRRKRLFYQCLSFLLTFLSYTAYHMNKKTFSVVKSVLSPTCSGNNNSCQNAWKPFTGDKADKHIFSLLDFTFLMTYSLSLFVSGYLAENTKLRLFLSFGMLLTGVSTSLFGLARYLQVHSLPYFFIMQVLSGITQSTGLPSVTEAICMWIPGNRAGTVLGIWNLHQYFGNILGSLLSGSVVKSNWGLSFLLPAVAICCVAVLVYIFLIPHPNLVYIEIENPVETSVDVCSDSQALIEKDDEDGYATASLTGIGLMSALKTLGVIEYAVCIFFVKFVMYTFFFWLPYFINDVHTHDAKEAAYYSIYYDVGCAFGGVLAGIIYDLTDTPAIICSIMLVAAAPTVFSLLIPGNNTVMLSVYMLLSGCLISGPFTLIVSILPKRLDVLDCSRSNIKSVAIFTAIFDGAGSAGASFGPLLCGIIQAVRNSWKDVGQMLVVSTLLAVVALARQCFGEVKIITSKYRSGAYTYSKCSTGDESMNSAYACDEGKNSADACDEGMNSADACDEGMNSADACDESTNSADACKE